MTTPITRTAHDIARDRIETAWRAYPFCSECGQPMTIESHDGGLWIECTSLRTLTGFRRRLWAGFHERHPLEVSPEPPVDLAA
jgi:hypothetical protein